MNKHRKNFCFVPDIFPSDNEFGPSYDNESKFYMQQCIGTVTLRKNITLRHIFMFLLIYFVYFFAIHIGIYETLKLYLVFWYIYVAADKENQLFLKRLADKENRIFVKPSFFSQSLSLSLNLS